jgi:hypothetical protein
MFGAAGDGSGDHSVALQNWINVGLREDVVCEGLGTYAHSQTLYVDPQLAGCTPGSPIRRTWVVRGAGMIQFNFNDTSHGAHLRLLKTGAGTQIVRRIPTGYSYAQCGVNAHGIAFVRRDGSAGHGWLDQDLRGAGGEQVVPSLPQFRDVSFYGHSGVLRTLTITNVTTLSDGRAQITTSAAHNLRMFEFISIEGVGGATILNSFCGHAHSTPTATTFTIAMQPNAAYTSGGTVEVYSCGFTCDQSFVNAGVGGAEEGYVYGDWDGVTFQENAVSYVLGMNWNASFRGLRSENCAFGGSAGLTSSKIERPLVQGFKRFAGHVHTKRVGPIISPRLTAVIEGAHLEDVTLPIAIDVRPWRNASAINSAVELLVMNARRGGDPCAIRCVCQPNQNTGATRGDSANVRLLNFPQGRVDYVQWVQNSGDQGFGNTASDDFEEVNFLVGSSSAYTTSPRCTVRVWKGKTLYDNNNGLHSSVVAAFGPGSEITIPISIPAMAVGATWDGAFSVTTWTPRVYEDDIILWDLPDIWPAQIQVQFQARSGDRFHVKGVNAGSGAYAGGGPFDIRFYFLRRPNYGC